ncbi:MAG: 30S ribosomal protein S19 [Candidatus Heimdallarchaeum aukensis]|uniref:Small ribosomal subunit protein uS19 n=1 Tax=Candidatus Heimdallarchaeum aukensis TaxID=2876573 RepID=A0A9Y1BKV1_9ARCH|nr:MAG: 30S ribosomal protein S19 [Candidatus Heimdallarchaeum aukensis]
MSTKRYRFQGYTIDELKAMALDEVLPLLPSKRRRSLSRAEFWTPRRKKLLEDIREAAEALQRGEKKIVRTHVRDFPIIPEMIGLTIAVYNGKEFIEVLVQPEMIGMVLGDLSPTTKVVRHGAPGIGATKSSLYVPLK